MIETGVCTQEACATTGLRGQTRQASFEVRVRRASAADSCRSMVPSVKSLSCLTGRWSYQSYRLTTTYASTTATNIFYYQLPINVSLMPSPNLFISGAFQMTRCTMPDMYDRNTHRLASPDRPCKRTAFHSQRFTLH